jgi:signal transduction histidine kinase/purine-cytosine permease-like protein/DNA-binding NarL/FixJ family response regulator
MNKDATPTPGPDAIQRVVKVRRDYNTWVATETIEDYALRFTPRGFRRWSELRVANTAFGAASFLVLEAVGATLLVNYGFTNAALAIIATGLIIFAASLPICLYAARYGVDMDLLTRGAGFGYIGSTITSLIYASFTFVFYALEAAIMAYSLELAFHIPPSLGYFICALVVIPLVTHGVTTISRFQAWTQPLWIALLVLPYFFVLEANPGVLREIIHYGGPSGAGFDLYLFGAALTVGMALITQTGEQVDYLRFMPECTAANRRRWIAALLIGGPGWVLPGVAKMLGGVLLAYLAIRSGVPAGRAVDPNQMYVVAYGYVFPHPAWAVAITVLFVVISQLKINVTNAYAGSLAWSNFFSRLTHSHPGRIVWVVFNTLIALMLMELNVFQALKEVLGLYSNIAIAWMTTVLADLVVNKPLGLSPPGIEFKRAHLYDVNPVGVGAMSIASLLSVSAYGGVFGPGPEAFSALIAFAAAFVAAPLIAWATRGRYYLARPPEVRPSTGTLQRCCICEREYEVDDMARCPAYQGAICSLCCSLDARCDDLCKPDARLAAQWSALMRRVLPRAVWPYLETGLAHYLLLMAVITPLLALLLGLLYHYELRGLTGSAADLIDPLGHTYLRTFAALFLVSGIAAWWLVLTQKSRQVAQEESNRQTQLLMREIASHRHTDKLLQKAKEVADQANQAKSRYITAISHELRTPLNSILGYAQILAGDKGIPPNRRQAVSVIRRSGDHLLSLIEETLDIARIESGKLTLVVRPLDFPAFIQQLVAMVEQQAWQKGLDFFYRPEGKLPAMVRVDEKRLRQILLNIVGNAIKFTVRGSVTLRLRYKREMAFFSVEDTGPGIAADELATVFEPFSRGSAAHMGATGGTGLGLTIARMLTDLMGGEMGLESSGGQGCRISVRLYLPRVHGAQLLEEQPRQQRIGYVGARRRILVVDNEQVDRELLVNVLGPLDFRVAEASTGQACLEQIPHFRPHVIFVDLAMPGMDGWETIRRIHEGGLTGANIGILSANALEKRVDNDVGITPEDFITKPFRVDDLLDWIGTQLGLEWVHADLVAAPVPNEPPEPLPTIMPPGPQDLAALGEMIDLGYMRGILEQIDAIEQLEPAHGEFARVMRALAAGFQFDAMKEILRKSGHASN